MSDVVLTSVADVIDWEPVEMQLVEGDQDELNPRIHWLHRNEGNGPGTAGFFKVGRGKTEGHAKVAEIMYLIDGEMTVTFAAGTTVCMKPGDACFFPADGAAFVSERAEPCTVFFVVV
jgi:uncharacterized cupin superfamily protein